MATGSSITDEVFKPKTPQEERDKLMQEFLDKGGKVDKLKPGIAKGASSLNKSGNLQWSTKQVIDQENNNDFVFNVDRNSKS